ncbi:MAG: fibronectin type III domain-containing protein, partial [candidate division Zixibacteria bacterium]|nr:fibronectin type III domain-containing protein [candidate division Zixibacteria bacterium]
HVYVWYRDGKVSSGTSSDLDKYRAPYNYSLPPGKVPADIVGTGIAGDDHVYVWYRDNMVSSGTTSDLDKYRALYSYTVIPAIPPRTQKTPADIVGMGIACSDDHVYTWYGDGTVSSGSSSDLDLHRTQYEYSLPPGRTPADIVGMGIAGDDHVYVWYRDGTVSSGTSFDLDKYRTPYRYSLSAGKTPADIVGMAIACSNDHVYVWYQDGTVSSGSSSDFDLHRRPYQYSLGLVPPETPTNLEVTAKTDVSLKLHWKDNSDCEQGFKIEQRQGTNWREVGSEGRNEEYHTVGSLSPGTEYCFRIKAWNDAGQSEPSNEACGKTLAAQPEGFKEVEIFNCYSERRTVYVWVRDITIGGSWRQMGSVPSHWPSSGPCPMGTPLVVPLIDGHVYQIRAVEPNDVDCGSCLKMECAPIKADAAGPVYRATVGIGCGL